MSSIDLLEKCNTEQELRDAKVSALINHYRTKYRESRDESTYEYKVYKKVGEDYIYQGVELDRPQFENHRRNNKQYYGFSGEYSIRHSTIDDEVMVEKRIKMYKELERMKIKEEFLEEFIKMNNIQNKQVIYDLVEASEWGVFDVIESLPESLLEALR